MEMTAFEVVGGFFTTPVRDGVTYTWSHQSLRSTLRCVEGAGKFGLHGATTFGFVVTGQGDIVRDTGIIMQFSAGMYFAVPGTFELRGEAKVVLFERAGYDGLFMIGGPVEDQGRFAYIDGCRNTLLYSPPVQGDPTINMLFVPPHVRQSMHTHPTVRFGIVLSGSGRCVTPEGQLDLSPGSVFVLESDAKHCFYTDEGSLEIVTYHPDSDWGPTDEAAPMRAQTILVQ